MRKVIQLTSSVLHGNNIREEYLYALCDDGTVWVKTRNGSNPQSIWTQLDDVPRGREYDPEDHR